MQSAHPASAQSAPALRKSVQILDFISNSSHQPTFTEIVTHLKLPKSSAHVLCATLVELGLLVRNQSGTYRLGPHTLRWANGFMRQTALAAEFHAQLTIHKTLNNFTVTLAILEDIEVIYLASVNSQTELGITFRIGMRLPAPFTATGKAILSAMTSQQLDTLFDDRWPKPLTSQSTPNLAHLKSERITIIRNGFSVDKGEIRDGMLCFGAPVMDSTDLVCAGVAVSMLAADMTEQQMTEIGRDISRFADDLSQRLGKIKA